MTLAPYASAGVKDELELFPCVVRPLGKEVTKGKRRKSHEKIIAI